MAGQLWKPGVSSGALRLQGLEAPGGAADLLSWGRSVLAVLGPPGLCLSRGRPDPGLCPGALGSGPALLDSRSRRPSPPELHPPRSPLRGAAPEPPQLLPARSPLRGAAARAPPSCSRVLPCALQPLGSSAHCPGAQVSVSVPGSPRASPPSWVLLQLPASPFPPGRSVQLLLLRDGALLSWGHSPRPQPGSSRGPSPWRPFVSLFLFPRLPTLIEARTLLTVAFQLFSL